MANTPNHLELVSSTDLIQELQARFDDFVLIAAQHRTKLMDDITVCFGGSLHGVFGLLDLARLAAESGSGGMDEPPENDLID